MHTGQCTGAALRIANHRCVASVACVVNWPHRVVVDAHVLTCANGVWCGVVVTVEVGRYLNSFGLSRSKDFPLALHYPTQQYFPTELFPQPVVQKHHGE